MIFYRKPVAGASVRRALPWEWNVMKRVCLLGFAGLFALTGCNAFSSKAGEGASTEGESAIARLLRSHTLEPGVAQQADLLYEILAAEIAGHQGDLDTSVDYYLRAAAASRDPAVAERGTRIAMYARDYERALKAARRWVELAPEGVEARRTLAMLLLRTEDVDGAVAELQTVLRLADESTDSPYLLIARLLAHEQDQALGMRAMQALVDRNPEQARAHYALAQLAMQFDENDVALEAVRQALQLQPDWPDAHLIYARLLIDDGKAEQALEDMAQAVESYPEQRELRVSYARLLAETDQYDRAREQFDRLLSDTPEDETLLYTVALLAIEAERYEMAEQYLMRLTELGKRLDDAHYFLGAIEQERENYPQAIAWYDKVTGGGRALDARIRSAGMWAKQGEIEKARTLLQDYDAKTTETVVRLAIAETDVLRQASRYKEALAVANTALAKAPDDADLLYARAMVAEKLDRIDLLETDLKRILSRDPDNSHALNALGYTLADRTERYQEAYEYIKKALELSPDEAAILDSMGWVQYRLGNLEEAARYLRSAYEKDPDAEIAAHLGEVLWAMGERDQARAIWQEAKKREPENPVLQKTIKRLN